jgi:hypothetical protein
MLPDAGCDWSCLNLQMQYGNFVLKHNVRNLFAIKRYVGGSFGSDCVYFCIGQMCLKVRCVMDDERQPIVTDTWSAHFNVSWRDAVGVGERCGALPSWTAKIPDYALLRIR